MELNIKTICTMRNSFSLSLIAIVAMTLSSCTDWVETELVPSIPSLAGGTVTEFTVSMNTDGTRAGLDTNETSVWHSGDNMTIVKFNPGQVTPQVLHAAALDATISDDGKTMTFACEMPIHAEGEQYAIFPAQSSTAAEDYTNGKIGNRTFNVELPEQELAQDGTFRYPFLLGHWKEPASVNERGSFQFTNPFTILKITLKKPANENQNLVLTNIQVKGNNEELMWGTAEASIADNGNGTFTKGVKMLQGAEYFASLDTRVDGVGQTITTEGNDFYVCIPAQNYSKGMTLTFFCEGDDNASIWYMEKTLMSRGVDCSAKGNTLVTLPALELDVEKSNIFTALVRSTATTLAMSWTTKVSNSPYLAEQKPNSKANYQSEMGYSYIIELWTDDACEYNTNTLVQSWIIKNNEWYWKAGDDTEKRELFTAVYAPMRFIFSYLNPATTYYFRVMYSTDANADPNDLTQWKVLENPRKVQTANPFASNVETILFEDFRDCVLGGDYSTRSAGYSSYTRGDYSTVLEAVINRYDAADSENATDNTHRYKLPNLEGIDTKGVGADYHICNQGNETALFTTMCNVVAGTTGECPGNYKTWKGYTSKLKDWAWFSDDDAYGTVLMRAGYTKVGAMYKHTGIVTPQLSMLSGPSTVTVEFYACPFGSSVLDKGELPIAVKLLDGVTVYEDTTTDNSSRWKIRNNLNRIDIATVDAATSTTVPITLEGNQYSWKKYTVTLTGVLPTSRIAFCSNREEANTNNRFLLDDVHIYLNQTEPLTVKLVKATDSTVSIAWTSTVANIPTMADPKPTASYSTDEIDDTYAVAIYDADKKLLGKMSNMLTDHNVASGNLFSAVQKPPRWVFSGLTPETKYYVKVWNTTKGTESGYLEVSTTAPLFERDEVVPLNETAVAGHMLLFENFEKCLYGGDHTTRAAGYKHKSYVAEGRYLVGAGELTDNTSAYYCVGAGANVGFFSTTKVQIPTMGFDEWSWVYSDNATAATSIVNRPGYVQVGTGGTNNWLVTPSLTNMPAGNSSLRVTFRACPYGAAGAALSDAELLEKAIAIRVLTGGSVNSSTYQLTGYTVADTKKLTLEGNNNTVWKEYTVDLHNVPQGARIAFGGGRTDYGDNRFFLDDVRIQLVNNSDLLVGLVRATDTTLNIGWTETAENADTFLTHLPATATKSGSTVTTTYKYDFNTSDNSNEYAVYLYTDEACTKLYQSWNGTPDFWHDGKSTDSNGVTTYTNFFPTRFIFTGLEPSTDYFVLVRNNISGKQSSAVKVSTVASQYQGNGITVDPDNLRTGNTILFNNFGKMYYCGDLTGYAMGYSINSGVAASQTENFNAQGHLPYNNDTRVDFDRRRCNTEHSLFTTYAGMLDDYGMSDWSYMSDDSQARVLIKPGYIKIGNGNCRAHIVTPLLAVLPEGEIWSVKVRFKACPFTEANYVHYTEEDDIIVAVYEGGDVGATVDGVEYPYCFVNGSIVDSQTLNLSSHVGEWKTYEVTLNNVTCDCRIGIGGARATAGQNRFYVDDIEVLAADASDVKYLTGYIWENNGTTPVEGVMVTDGYHVTKTNAKGKYRLLYEPSVYKPEFVYYTTPAGYEIGRNGTGIPVTYSKVGVNPDPENTLGNGHDYAKDFKLGPKMTSDTHRNFNDATGKHDKWFLFVMADPQTHEATGGEHNDKCLERFKNYVAPDIKARVSGFNSAIDSDTGTGQAYGVICGDVTWNAPGAHHATMKSALEVGDTGVYWFATPGNHDWYQGDSDTSPTISHFKEVYGPTRISFDRGDMHVVVLNNIVVKDGSTSLDVENYQAGFTDDEFTWLQNDLSHVDKNKGVVLVVHIPFRQGSAVGTKSGTNVMKDHYYDAVLTELAKFQHAYIFAGHSHYNQTYVHTGFPTAGGDYVTEIVHCAVSGTVYHTSICADGSPAGYTIYTFEGNRAKHQRFKAIGTSGALDDGGWKNNIRMYWGPGSTTGNYVSLYRFNASKTRIVANVFMSHSAATTSKGVAIEPKKGIPGELSGDWVVQLYDPQLKKWKNMKRVETSMIEQRPNWNSFVFNVKEKDSFLIDGSTGVTKAAGATEPADGWCLRNDVDWWWWSNVIEGNSYVRGRTGAVLGSQQNSKSCQTVSRHMWYGDLSYELTADAVKGTSHGVKVRAIPPCYGTNATVQTAIANGTDLNGYGAIYICDTFAQWGRTAAVAQPLCWTTVTSAY